MLCLRAIPQVTNCHLVIRTIACAEKQNQCLIICNRGIVHRSHLQRVLCFPPVFFCYAFASQFGSPHPDNALFLIPSRRTSGPHGLHHITGYSSFDISIKAYHSLFERCTHRSSDIYLQLSVSLSLSLSLFFLFSLLLSLSLSSLRPVILPHWGPFGEGNDDASLFLFPLILSRSDMLSDATLSDPQLSWTLLYSLTPCYAMLSM